MRLYFAWVISLFALFGSLYYGEVLQIKPCKLCWAERLTLFPISVLLGIALYQNRPKMALYCLPFSILGALLALYHCLVQFFPLLKIEPLCGGACGFSYMPLLSLAAFLSISILILLNPQKE